MQLRRFYNIANCRKKYTLNFQVINPFTGRPCRATLLGFLDWKSGGLNSEDPVIAKEAFLAWEPYATNNDLQDLKNINRQNSLYNESVKTRLSINDISATNEQINIITAKDSHMFQNEHKAWNMDVFKFIDFRLKTYNEERDLGLDSLLLRIPIEDARTLILNNIDTIYKHDDFIFVAICVANDEIEKKLREYFKNNPNVRIKSFVNLFAGEKTENVLKKQYFINLIKHNDKLNSETLLQVCNYSEQYFNELPIKMQKELIQKFPEHNQKKEFVDYSDEELKQFIINNIENTFLEHYIREIKKKIENKRINILLKHLLDEALNNEIIELKILNMISNKLAIFLNRSSINMLEKYKNKDFKAPLAYATKIIDDAIFRIKINSL